MARAINVHEFPGFSIVLGSEVICDCKFGGIDDVSH
jgi:hypothetical protein